MAIVYHGTSASPFDVFDPRMCLTAEHIYTTTDRSGAEYFTGGRGRVLEFEADMSKALDLSDPYEMFSVIRYVHEQIGEDFGLTDFVEFLDLVADGALYQHHCNSALQDAFLRELFAFGYDPIIIPDQMGGGRIGTSVVFSNPRLLTRVKGEVGAAA
jgi:hypothetical protein